MKMLLIEMLSSPRPRRGSVLVALQEFEARFERNARELAHLRSTAPSPPFHNLEGQEMTCVFFFDQYDRYHRFLGTHADPTHTCFFKFNRVHAVPGNPSRGEVVGVGQDSRDGYFEFRGTWSVVTKTTLELETARGIVVTK